jgi:formate dehydrogenase subunit delta
MANQIATFFAPWPEEQATLEVRDHLLKFWDPGMREELLAIASGRTPSPTPLAPLVRRALEPLRRDPAA